MSDPSEPSSLEQGDSESSSIRRRLEALDDLKEQGAITGAEHAEARRRVLSEVTGVAPPPIAPQPTAPITAPVSPPLEAPAELAPVDATPTALISSPPSPPVDPPPGAPASDTWDPKRKIRGVPLWGIGAMVAAAIALIVVGIIALSGSGSDGPKAPDTAALAAAYVTRIDRPLELLNRSAVAVGKQLQTTSEPSDIASLRRVATRQLSVVEDSRRALSEVEVAPSNRKAHQALIRAVGQQRRYLVALMRASSGTPRPASIQASNRARLAGSKVLSGYRSFYALMPGAADAITGTDLTDVSGLRTAVKAAIAKAAAEAEAARQRAEAAAEAQRRAADPSYNGAVFSSVSGTDQGGTLYITGSYCDRTPGAVNTMYFTMNLYDPSGSLVDTETQQLDVTRACDSVSWYVSDRFGVGSYTIRIQADNLTNNASGSGSGYIYIS